MLIPMRARGAVVAVILGAALASACGDSTDADTGVAAQPDASDLDGSTSFPNGGQGGDGDAQGGSTSGGNGGGSGDGDGDGDGGSNASDGGSDAAADGGSSMPLPESCSAPLVLAPNTPVAGDTTTAVNDMGGSISAACGASNLPGPDLVYVFTPISSGSVTLTVHPTSSWDVALWVASPCADSGGTCTNLADTGGDGDDEVVVAAFTAATPYYIVVDSWSSSAFGPFTLTVTP